MRRKEHSRPTGWLLGGADVACTHTMGLGLGCLMTPGLNKDIRCHV